MNKSVLIKKFLFFPAIYFISFSAWSQECVVEKASLKGTYTGDCKKGKAHGHGKAVGSDIYEGEFKAGFPDGLGTYTWWNGNSFTGKYVKGLKEGKGKIIFKKEGDQDSLVEGFWKKDVYIGKYESAWKVHGKTGSIRDVDVEFTPDDVRRVKIIITNTTGGVKTTGSREMPRFKVDHVQTLSGSFIRMTSLESHLKSTEASLMQAEFPLRVKLTIAQEELDIEFFESGSYTVNISINN